jgi:putative membrane protein
METNNKFLIGEPQKQSAASIVVEGLIVTFKSIKAFWYFVIFAIIRLMRQDMMYLWLGLAIVLFLVVIVGYLRYHYFRFFIDTDRDEFVLTEGVFSKKRVAIQLSRIQQVNVNQSLVQRLLNVYGVEINTAGSTKSEASIAAVGWEVAQALRQHLLPSGVESNGSQSSEVKFPDEIAPLLTIKTESLVKHGLTAKYIESFSLLIAFLFAIYNNIKDVVRLQDEDEKQVDQMITSFFVVNSLMLFIIGLFILAIGINLVRTILTYYRLHVRKEGIKLEIRYGLLQTRTTLLNPHKVQMVRVVANYFQKKIGLRWLTVKQASSDSDTDVRSYIHFPGLSVDEKDTMLYELFGKLPHTDHVLKPSLRFFVMKSFQFAALPTVVYLLLWYFDQLQNHWGWGIAYFLLAMAVVWRLYINSSLEVGQEFIQRKQGFWDLSTTILEPYKIQAIRTKQFFWQRSSNTGEVTLFTSGGHVRFTYGDYKQIKSLVNVWLKEIESSRKPWM